MVGGDEPILPHFCFAPASERSSSPALHSLVSFDPHSHSLPKLLRGSLGRQASGHLFWLAEAA